MKFKTGDILVDREASYNKGLSRTVYMFFAQDPKVYPSYAKLFTIGSIASSKKGGQYLFFFKKLSSVSMITMSVDYLKIMSKVQNSFPRKHELLNVKRAIIMIVTRFKSV